MTQFLNEGPLTYGWIDYGADGFQIEMDVRTGPMNITSIFVYFKIRQL